MKRLSSIKSRITMWYTAVMLMLLLIFISAIIVLSYQISMDSIENDLKLQVVQISDMVKARITESVSETVQSKEYKNVAIYQKNGEFIVGHNNEKLSGIAFEDKSIRKETVDGQDYIVYDILKTSAVGNSDNGYWIRGVTPVDDFGLFGETTVIALLIMLPLFLLFAALGGYYITKKAFAPVADIVGTANEIYAHNNLGERIPIKANAHKDELYELSLTLNKMLEQIEEVIEQEKQFTSDASHELRTPITVILAQGEYLLDIAQDEKERELAEDIVYEAKRLSTLVSALLLLARIDKNRQKLNMEDVSLSDIVESVVYTQRELAEEKNIKIITQTDGSPTVRADEALLSSAVNNLVNNAIKYGKENGQTIITVTELDDTVQISVKDDGIGIAEDNLDKIWTRFYKVDSVRAEDSKSYGLGLSMVKSIVELHSGEIGVQSVLGEGTEFTVTLKK